MKGICKWRYNDPDLQGVADAFVELQQARHLGDYDYANVFTRVAVLTHIKTIEKAFKQWNHFKSKPIAQDFLLALFIPDRG